MYRRSTATSVQELEVKNSFITNYQLPITNYQLPIPNPQNYIN
ncbi:MAG: hypothetical protein AAF757_09070 [Cyanobacteria bacterium P01_D01_bin.116]